MPFLAFDPWTTRMILLDARARDPSVLLGATLAVTLLLAPLDLVLRARLIRARARHR